MRVYTFAILVILLFPHSSHAVTQEVKDCTEQAERAFQKWSADKARSGLLSHSAKYASHHNSLLNKCLMLIDNDTAGDGKPETIMGGTLNTSIIIDAYEGREYAMYSHYIPPISDDQFFDVIKGRSQRDYGRASCVINADALDDKAGIENIRCTSREDFYRLTDKYFKQ